MITLIPIEPLNEAHGMLIVEAFSRLFINEGGEEDGHGNGWGSGYGERGGNGWGDGDGSLPEEWRVGP